VNPSRRIDGRRLSHEVNQTVRRLAVQRVVRGLRPSDVSRDLGLCRTTIYRWLRAYERDGVRGLAARTHPGRAPRAPRASWDDLRRVVLAHAPRDAGLDALRWTRRAAAELIARRTGVRIDLPSAGRLLARLGLVPRGEPIGPGQELPQSGAATLFAVDGRGAFLCARIEASDGPVRRASIARRLAEAAGPRCSLRFRPD
jgi:transposase